jgi:hypothetical protein
MLLSPASLTLKFDAIFDVPEGDEALSDSALPLLFRPLSPRALDSPPGLPISYSHNSAPIVEEIIVASPASGSSTLVASPATPGHGSSVRGIAESPRSVRLVHFTCLYNCTRRTPVLTSATTVRPVSWFHRKPSKPPKCEWAPSPGELQQRPVRLRSTRTIRTVQRERRDRARTPTI